MDNKYPILDIYCPQYKCLNSMDILYPHGDNNPYTRN